MALRSSGSLSMKLGVVVGLLCLLVPIASWAHSSHINTPSTCFPGAVCVFNEGGTGTGGLGGLNVTGLNASTVTAIGTTPVSGTLSFTTGGFTNLSGKATFGSGICALNGHASCTVGTFATGSLTIKVNSWNGFSGTLFTGSFGGSGGISWVYDGKLNGLYQYALVGPISGTWGPSGGTVAGQTAQLFFSSKKPFTGKAGQVLSLTSGTTTIVTPEPANIGLLGTGLILMGFLVRRRAKQQQSEENKD